MTSLPLIWKTHKHRDEYENCPHCGEPLKWIYDGLFWIPCDHKPVLFVMHPEGKSSIVYEKQLLEGRCLIFNARDERCRGVTPLWGYQQHYFTCEILKERRRAYAMAHRFT